MKLLWMWVFLFTVFFPAAFAETSVNQKLSIIKSIDDLDLPPSYNDASEEAYPLEEWQGADDFTVLPESRVRDLFDSFTKDSRARNRVAGGKCSVRRSYIQSYLKKLNILSGSLYIQCPSNSGHMKLIDQVTGHRYTFSNFHDVNLVAIPNGYNVMDVQFESRPMSLSEYLAQVEASQKLKPLKNRESADRGYCYWSIR